jgi:hypothetical protein
VTRVTKRLSFPESDRAAVEIDTTVAHASRVYDYLLGGTDNFDVDRRAAEYIFSAYPGGVETVRIDALINRWFLGRVVRYMVEVGLRQFLDIGTGIPNTDNAHGVAQKAAPECRIVYVDNDPIVLAHAHLLLRSTPEGVTDFIEGDLLEPEAILEKAAETLDFSAPVGVLLIGILHVVPEEEDPYGIVATLMDAVPSGSHLAISQLTDDVQIENMAEVSRRVGEVMGRVNPPGFRSRASIGRFFDDLELLEPGVVQADQWRPDATTPDAPEGHDTPLYGAVGRKP